MNANNNNNNNNSPQSSNCNITVGIRVRPMNRGEAGHGSVVRVLNEHVLLFHSSSTTTTTMQQQWGNSRQQRVSLFPRPKNYVCRDQQQKQRARDREATFMFDHVFDENSNSAQVFESTTKALVDSVLKGYNCTCFAYGATGAGKTFTMIGNTSQPGVMVLTMQHLFDTLEQEGLKASTKISVSYLEIYNETIHDLLVENSPSLLLFEENDTVTISGLSSHTPTSAQHVLHLLEEGNARRSQSSTDANTESSRSHAIFQVLVCQTTSSLTTTGLCSTTTVTATAMTTRAAKLSLVDLAGSERASRIQSNNHHNSGQRMIEGANINKSLLALGNCINALESGKEFVPYRGSKLTRLLKDSLGGNCKTVMIANVSPSALCGEDTWNTLQYANRTKNIKSHVWSNEREVTFQATQYKEMVLSLQEEVQSLKRQCLGQSQIAIDNANDSKMVSQIRSKIISKTESFRKLNQEIVNILEAQKRILSQLTIKEQEFSVFLSQDKEHQKNKINNSSHHHLLQATIKDLENKFNEYESAIDGLIDQFVVEWSHNLMEDIRNVRFLSNQHFLEESIVCCESQIQRMKSDIKQQQLELKLFREESKTRLLSECNVFLQDRLLQLEQNKQQQPAPEPLSNIPPSINFTTQIGTPHSLPSVPQIYSTTFPVPQTTITSTPVKVFSSSPRKSLMPLHHSPLYRPFFGSSRSRSASYVPPSRLSLSFAPPVNAPRLSISSSSRLLSAPSPCPTPPSSLPPPALVASSSVYPQKVPPVLKQIPEASILVMTPQGTKATEAAVAAAAAAGATRLVASSQAVRKARRVAKGGTNGIAGGAKRKISLLPPQPGWKPKSPQHQASSKENRLPSKTHRTASVSSRQQHQGRVNSLVVVM